MKIGGGLNNEGLIFGYDAEGFKFGGEPTTNLVPNGGVGGMSGVALNDLGVEDGWKKYSLSGTFAGGTYPYVMHISSTTFTGGVKYSSQIRIKTNASSKFNYFAANGISYLNEPQDHGGVNTSELQSDGSYLLRRQGFAYTNTTSQVGYLWTNPINNTTFDPATDFVWVKDVQIEQKDHCTKYVNGTRSNTESLFDITGGRNLDTSSISFTSNEIPTFNGTSHNIDLGTVGGYSSNVTCEAVIKATGSASWKNIMSGGCGDIIFTVNGSRLNFGCQCNSPILHDNFSTTTINDNNYHHVVGTYDGSNIRIYVDGVLESTNPETGNFTPSNLRVGSNYIGSSEFYQGELPMVRLYNRTLPTNEVVQNFLSVKSRFGLS